jgi:hypothetical protein
MADEKVRQGVPHVIPQEMRQHLRAARAEFRQSVEAMVPPEFLTHRRAARREMLLAARSLIDHALERLQEKNSA